MTYPKIRQATPRDAAALLSVYRPYVEQTTITFEYEVPTVEEFARRIAQYSSFYPYLVWEEKGQILGYAYAHRHQERAAYQWNAELSIYLAPDARSRGIGTRLYGALIELLILQGIQNLYGCVTMPNIPSDALHRKMGFSRCCDWHHSGYKHGKWLDVAWYELNLTSDTPPAPLRSFYELSPKRVADVFFKYESPADVI